jgi:hypothetical protein
MQSVPPTSARRLVATLVVIASAAIVLAPSSPVAASHDFPDVPNSHPFHFDIEWLENHGITEGFPDGTFRPNQPVTRGSMAAFLHRMDGDLRPVQFDRPFHVQVTCAATTRWAVISGAGAFVRGSAGTSASKISIGTYQVTFNTDVSGCGWQVSVGVTGNVGSTTGWATVAGRSGNVNALFIATYDTPSGIG